jgi:hypothetical protein
MHECKPLPRESRLVRCKLVLLLRVHVPYTVSQSICKGLAKSMVMAYIRWQHLTFH